MSKVIVGAQRVRPVTFKMRRLLNPIAVGLLPIGLIRLLLLFARAEDRRQWLCYIITYL